MRLRFPELNAPVFTGSIYNNSTALPLRSPAFKALSKLQVRQVGLSAELGLYLRSSNSRYLVEESSVNHIRILLFRNIPPLRAVGRSGIFAAPCADLWAASEAQNLRSKLPTAQKLSAPVGDPSQKPVELTWMLKETG